MTIETWCSDSSFDEIAARVAPMTEIAMKKAQMKAAGAKKVKLRYLYFEQISCSSVHHTLSC